MHLHGAVLVSWFLMLIFQSWLVREERSRVHMTLGIFGAAYGYLIAPVALLATLNVVSRHNGIGVTLDADMVEVNPALSAGMSFLAVVCEVVGTNIMAVCTVVILLTVAIVLRRKSAVHKRLILLATVFIMGSAFARLSRWELLGGEQGPFIPLALLTLLITLFVYDYARFKKIHRATWMAILLIVLLNGFGFFMSGSEIGQDFVRSLA